MNGSWRITTCLFLCILSSTSLFAEEAATPQPANGVFAECAGYNSAISNNAVPKVRRQGNVLTTLFEFDCATDPRKNCVFLYGLDANFDGERYRRIFRLDSSDSNITDWSRYQSLEFFVYFYDDFEANLVLYGPPKLGVTDPEPVDNHVILFNEPIAKYVVNGPQLRKWLHVVIPLDDIIGRVNPPSDGGNLGSEQDGGSGNENPSSVFVPRPIANFDFENCGAGVHDGKSAFVCKGGIDGNENGEMWRFVGASEVPSFYVNSGGDRGHMVQYSRNDVVNRNFFYFQTPSYAAGGTSEAKPLKTRDGIQIYHGDSNGLSTGEPMYYRENNKALTYSLFIRATDYVDEPKSYVGFIGGGLGIKKDRLGVIRPYMSRTPLLDPIPLDHEASVFHYGPPLSASLTSEPVMLTSVYHPSSKTYEIYLNGEFSFQYPLPLGETPYSLVSSKKAPTVFFAMGMAGVESDNLRMFDESFTPEQVRELYRQLKVDPSINPSLPTSSIIYAVGVISENNQYLKAEQSQVTINGISQRVNNAIALDKMYLRPKADVDRLRICSAEVPDSNFASAWIVDLDDPRKSSAGKYLGQFACDDTPGYGWTGSQCCGDDTTASFAQNPSSSFSEYFNDSTKGCWQGNSIIENTLVMEARYVRQKNSRNVTYSALCRAQPCEFALSGNPTDSEFFNVFNTTYTLRFKQNARLSDSLGTVQPIRPTDDHATLVASNISFSVLFYNASYFGCNAPGYVLSRRNSLDGAQLVASVGNETDPCVVRGSFFCDLWGGWSNEISADLPPTKRNVRRPVPLGINLLVNPEFEVFDTSVGR